MTHTSIDIATLEALEKAATPGPWELNADNASYIQIRIEGRIRLRVANGKDHQTAAFIVALRNDAHELIKAVKERDELREVNEFTKHFQQGLCEQTFGVAAENASLRALLAEAGERMIEALDACNAEGFWLGDKFDATSAAIQSALRDASPTMEKPK